MCAAVFRGGPLYLTHFGLAEAPFSTTPDQRFLYLSERHREGFAHLLYGVAERGGFVQLTGEVGTGKTTLCRYLLEHLPEDVDVALLLNPTLAGVELLATICDELRVAYPAGTDSVKVLVDALYARMLDAHARGRRTVIIVDEAQHLSVEALEELRLLTNFETATAKLLQIILVGQPELIKRLSRTELRQVAQRVAARYHLMPLDASDTRAYVLHRLSMAGQPAMIFDERALRLVHRLSGGLPRRINVLCDRALLGAYASRTRRVTPAIVRRAAREVAGERGPRRARYERIAAAVVLLVALSVASALVASPLARWKRSAEAQRAAPLPVAASPATTAPVVHRAALSTLLDVDDVGTETQAYAAVAARWGVRFQNRDEAPCKALRRSGLECLPRRGTWALVRQFDLPAVLEIVNASGAVRYLALTHVDGDSATVELGARREVVAVRDIERDWQGSFVALWRPPRIGMEPMVPGMKGADVAWLRQRLAALDGQPALAGAGARVYDEPLAARVLAFQRAQRLTADGIAGAETLARLSVVADPSAPALARPGAGS